MERLNALQNQECVEWRKTRAGIAQPLHAGLQNKGKIAECRGVRETVVGGIGLDKVREAAGFGPIELAAVHDDSGDAVAVAAQILGGRMHDDVRAPIDGFTQNWRGNRVVDDERNAHFRARWMRAFRGRPRRAWGCPAFPCRALWCAR